MLNCLLARFRPTLKVSFPYTGKRVAQKKRSRFSEEQVIGILKEAEAGERPAITVCRKHGISEQTFYRWKSKYGGMEVSEAKRLKTLLADTLLDNSLLKEALGKNW